MLLDGICSVCAELCDCRVLRLGMSLRSVATAASRCVFALNQQSSRNVSSVAVIGACFDKGQPKHGTSLGPAAIRKTGVIDDISKLGLQVNDLGDMYPQLSATTDQIATQNDARIHNGGVIGAFNKQLCSRLAGAVSAHDMTVMLGGDHSTAIGTVQGHATALHTMQQQHVLTVLWIDAHADINTPLTSSTGNCHGQSLAFSVRDLVDESVRSAGQQFSWCRPVLQPQHLVYIALRDVDAPELHTIRRLGIQAYSMRDVDQLGIRKVMEMTLDHLDVAQSSLHVSFDVDALDVTEAPSTGTPVRGGLTLREAQTIMEAVHESGRVRCVDVVEVNPLLGSAEQVNLTTSAARQVLLSALGAGRCRI